MTDRMEKNYSDLDLGYLDSEDLLNIEIKAKALSLEECFAFLCIEETDIPEAELVYAKKAHRKGRAAGISSACDNMFAAMKLRGGGIVALDYLKRMSKDFSVEAEASPGSNTGFSFTVVMDEDK